MKDPISRRNFLKGALASGGLLGLTPNLKGLGRDEQDCAGELEKLFVDLQRRDAREKAHLFKALTEKYGSGVLRVVEQFVIAETEARLEKAEIPRRGIEGIMENLWNRTHSTHEFRIEKKTGRSLKLRITRCLYAEEMRKWNAADIGLAFYCSYDYGFCRGLNRRIVFKRTKTLMSGDDCCDHTYELGGRDPGETVGFARPDETGGTSRALRWH